MTKTRRGLPFRICFFEFWICFEFRASDFGFAAAENQKPKGTHMNTETATRKRDQRLRRRLLQVMDAAKVRPESGWVTGRFVFDVVDGALPGGQQFDSDDHCTALFRDLISSGYVEERD